LIKYEKYAATAMANSEFKEALHYLNNLLRQCTDSMDFVAKKIEVFIQLHRLPEAIEYSTQIQNQFINNPDFLYWRGLVLIYNGSTDMGRKHVREALNKDPDNPKFQKTWKNLMKTEKVKNEASELFKAGSF
jgi:predicted Zn-dependent protease